MNINNMQQQNSNFFFLKQNWLSYNPYLISVQNLQNQYLKPRFSLAHELPKTILESEVRSSSPYSP